MGSWNGGIDFPKKNTINFQVSQRGRHKMSDAFTDVAKMKKIKEEIKAHEGQVVEMTLENGRKRQKKTDWVS